MADQLLQANGQSRPSNIKHHTSPSLMMNSHFAGVGDNADKQSYEHGIQVIDEDKMFKYVTAPNAHGLGRGTVLMSTRRAAETCLHTSVSKMSSPPDSTTTSYPSLVHNQRANRLSSITCLEPSLASCRNRNAGKLQREFG